jgi:hypothetical protein
MTRTKFFLLLVMAAFAIPRVALAHEKWFVDGSRYPIRWELLVSWPVLVALAVVGLALLALTLLRRVVRDPMWPNPLWLRPVNPSSQAVVGIQTAISLVFVAAQGWLLAPRLNLPDSILVVTFAVIQLFVAWTFVTGWLTRLGGAVLIGLVVSALAFFPPAYVLEQVLFVGIGVYFLIAGRGLFRPVGDWAKRTAEFWGRYSRFALPALRIGTGFSITVLAFTEKLLNPQLALAFLQAHPEFNFMRLLGFGWFSDDLFVYAAGAVEAMVGVCLMAGILPRVVILFMWLPFNITIPLLPPEELLGHLPILAVMYAVFLERADEYLPATQSTANPGMPARTTP